MAKHKLHGVHLQSRSYTHHARQLTSTEITDVVRENPSLIDWVRSLVEVEVQRVKINESGVEGRIFPKSPDKQAPITEEPSCKFFFLIQL